MRPCPFCAATIAASPVEGARCPSCGRDPTAPRRVCDACKKMTPTSDRACVHCGAGPANELAWKVPLIIALFVGAAVLSVVVAALTG